MAWAAVATWNVADLRWVNEVLHGAGFRVSSLKSENDLQGFLLENRPDILILDSGIGAAEWMTKAVGAVCSLEKPLPREDIFLERVQERIEKAERERKSREREASMALADGEGLSSWREKGVGATLESSGRMGYDIGQTAKMDAGLLLAASRVKSKDFSLSGYVDFNRVREVIASVAKDPMHEEPQETDPLTGLLGKAAIQDALGERCRTQRGVLIALNLDNMRLVNEIYGRETGDRMLSRFAGVLRASMRTSDQMGRIAGDDFVMFCQQVTEEKVIHEKIRQINADFVRAGKELCGRGMTVTIGVSAGAVRVPEEGQDFITLYQKAVDALFMAKDRGRHECSFYSRMDWKGAPKKGSYGTAVLNELVENVPVRSAFLLPYEEFRTIFRLLQRMNRDFPREHHIVTFKITNLSCEDGEFKLLRDRFLQHLLESFRSRDAVTCVGEDQVLVLLLRTGKRNSRLAAERVLRKWEELGIGAGCDVDYELAWI